MKLYELTTQYKSLELLEASEDLPAEVIRDTLEGLTGDLEAKSVNVGYFIRNMEATAEAIEAAAKAMQERADRARKRAQSLKDYLLFNMQGCGISKIECEHFALTVRNNPPSVVIDNEADIPEPYWTQPPQPPLPPKQINKRAIADAIKLGVEVRGAHTEQKQRLEIKL